jgi:hypothetical protein
MLGKPVLSCQGFPIFPAPFAGFSGFYSFVTGFDMTAKRKDPVLGVPRGKEQRIECWTAQTNNPDEHSKISARRIKWRAAAGGAD